MNYYLSFALNRVPKKLLAVPVTLLTRNFTEILKILFESMLQSRIPTIETERSLLVLL